MFSQSCSGLVHGIVLRTKTRLSKGCHDLRYTRLFSVSAKLVILQTKSIIDLSILLFPFARRHHGSISVYISRRRLLDESKSMKCWILDKGCRTFMTWLEVFPEWRLTKGSGWSTDEVLLKSDSLFAESISTVYGLLRSILSSKHSNRSIIWMNLVSNGVDSKPTAHQYSCGRSAESLLSDFVE